MSVSINNNITALNAWRNLKSTDSKMSSAMEKLSSGLRINRAADDPAGLVISEKMRAQLSGLSAAQANSQKAINMVQTAEGALDQVQTLLDKMRQLAIDSANSGVNDTATLKANQDELDAAINSINRIASYTQFGTKSLLDGTLGNNFTADPTDVSAASFGGISGVNKTGTVRVTLAAAAAQAATTLTFTAAMTNNLATHTLSFTLNGVAVNINAGEDIAAKINGYQSQTGVTASINGTFTTLTLSSVAYGSTAGVAYVAANAGTSLTGGTASTAAFGTNAVASVAFADGTAPTFSQGQGLTLSDGAGDTIVLTSGFGATPGNIGTATSIGTLTVNSANFQVGANENQTVALSIQSMKATDLGVGATYTTASGINANVTAFTDLAQLGSSAVAGGGGTVFGSGAFVSGGDDAIAQAVGMIDKAIDQVSTVRGSLGAIQSDNLQAQLDSLRVSYENLQASESTIRDTDMTSEMANFTKYQVMMQAGTAMLAQANQIPNTILKLLQ